jgi:hypothetical protein
VTTPALLDTPPTAEAKLVDTAVTDWFRPVPR